MSRILFDTARPVVESDPARHDVACFVGLARAIGTALAPATLQWLQVHGWTDGPLARSTAPPFTDLPIPIENYNAFTALFDQGGSDASFGTDYLATAVRSFFAQGGRRCYVVRMDNPITNSDGQAQKAAKLASLLPGDLYAVDDPRSWHGAGHLGGLPDASFLSLPDLPALCASAATAAQGVTQPVAAGPSQFVECGPPAPAAKQIPLFDLPAPALTPDDYKNRWAPAVQTVLTYLLQNDIREITFVAAFPLPQDLNAAAAAENPSSAALAQDVHDVITAYFPESLALIGTGTITSPDLSTAFFQLAYPWIVTTGSGVLNQSLEPPDGALVGILARNALISGAFTDATQIVPAEISDVFPQLPASELATSATPLVWGPIGGKDTWKPLITRVSLFGFTPAGLHLLSDVTTYPGEAYRAACVHRLVSVISRAARQMGERVVFRQNGPKLWAAIERSLTALLTQLWNANALEGDTAQDAFTVRCDSSTMTQNDLDNGRLVAQVTFTAAANIELIRVTLALETSGASAQGIAVLAEAS